jgi:putative ABC transport system ATP-binding protein
MNELYQSHQQGTRDMQGQLHTESTAPHAYARNPFDAIIVTKGLTKTFTDGDRITRVLKGIDISIGRGEFVAVMGRSGAGKSTLLYQLGLLDQPTDGEITIDGADTHVLTDDEKTKFRLDHLGYVFQDYALLPDLTALENVALPLLMQGYTIERAYELSTDALEKVGLGDRLKNLPAKLSGGQQQRVSIARAIAHFPKIIFADEPTANLDTESSKMILDIFSDLHKKGQTIVMVTHEEEYSSAADRVIVMKDGIVEEQRIKE